MPYTSVDQLQTLLTREVFHYARDAKKAAGRALGTIVETMTLYLLKAWGFTNALAIEQRIPEFGNPSITHNVEYSLHPVHATHMLTLPRDGRSLTATRILNALMLPRDDQRQRTNATLLSKDGVLRNACVIAKHPQYRWVASVHNIAADHYHISVAQQSLMPYAIIECKRVGVEEGTKRGPQTIEKAKQGAYVAKAVSSLQKVRSEDGTLFGLIYEAGQVLHFEPHVDLLQRVLRSTDPRLLRHFVLTVGVVSDHGNWFTADQPSKELHILAQAYDWLLFLSDQGITTFVEETLLRPSPYYHPIRETFLSSYAPQRRKNIFTKVQMQIEADRLLIDYFAQNAERIAQWFTVISPAHSVLPQLQNIFFSLHHKPWEHIRP